MSENEDFARRLHSTLEISRRKRSHHGKAYNIMLIVLALALVAVMVYILVTI